MMKREDHSAASTIQLRVQNIGQLFHTLDPLPFHERALDTAVEEYVVGWAGELPADQPISIHVRYPPEATGHDDASHVVEAIHNYFDYRAAVMGWELRDLFRTGRASLMIGLAVLAACSIAGKLTTDRMDGQYIGRFLEEGFIILGWVANWRPVEIFLYEWWPISRRRALYQRLATARVKLIPETSNDR